MAGRTHIGRVTVSGDAENGFRATLPKWPAIGDGIEAGDSLMVVHDPERGEIVFKKPDIQKDS